MVVLLTAVHRADAWGPGANAFSPDRFFPENLRKLPPRTYNPFGTDPAHVLAANSPSTRSS